MKCRCFVGPADTPAFFGFEIRALSPVVFDSQGKIIRWVDYWDATIVGGIQVSA